MASRSLDEKRRARREKGIGGFDFLGHLFSLFVHLHVFLGVVREIGIAAGIPGMQQFFALDVQLFLGDRQIEAEDLRASATGWVTSRP